MKTPPCAGKLAVLILAAAALAAQEGVTGTWIAEEVAFRPWTFILKADGTRVTGTVSQGGTEGTVTTNLTRPTKIYDGVIKGDKVSFKCDSPDGGVVTIIFSGVLAGDTLTFTRKVDLQPGGYAGKNGIYGLNGATAFTARRLRAPTAAAPPPGSAAAAASPPASPAAMTPAPPPAIVGTTAGTTASGALRVVFLGTGTPNADPDRSGPAVAVVAGTQAYLVDAGPGVVRRAAAAQARTQIAALTPTSLSLLFLTHLHSDHTLGYPDLIFTPAVLERGKPLEVFGPKGTEEMTSHLLSAWKKDMDVRINGPEQEKAAAYQVNVHEIKPGVVYQDGNVTVKAFLVKHATWDEAFGYRFDAAGRSLVISGDTVPTPAIAEACNGCDVLVHEVYCNEGATAYYKAAHTSAAELAEIAGRAKPKLLVLYHQLFSGCTESALLQQVQQGYGGAVVSAKDLDIY